MSFLPTADAAVAPRLNWFGEVPDGWRVGPLKRRYRVVLGKMLQGAAKDAGDRLLPYLRAANIQPHGLAPDDVQQMWFSTSEARNLRIQAGDVVVVEGGAGYGRAALADDRIDGWCFQNSINRLRAVGHDDPRFIVYAVQSAQASGIFEVLCNKATIPHLTAEKLEAVVVPIAPPFEQSAIADFLDRETAQIDELIAKQNALIELLGERRKAVITQAVTKGLDPSVPMKDSGVEWLGRVPAHWKVTTLKHRFTVLLGKMLDAGRSGRVDDLDLPYLRAANIQDHGLALGDVKTMPFTSREQKTLRLRANDLLVVEGGAVGTNYVVPEDMNGWFFQKTVNRVRSVQGDSTVLLGHLIRTYRDTGVIDMICNKSTIAHLTSEKLEILPIAVAPRDEQLQIEAYLGRQTIQIDALVVCL